MVGNVTERPRTRRDRSSVRRTSLVFEDQQDDTGVEVSTIDELISWIQAEPETAKCLLHKRPEQIEGLQTAQKHKDVEPADKAMCLREQLATIATRTTPSGQDQQIEGECARLRTELDDNRKEMATLRSERGSLMTVMRVTAKRKSG